MRNEIRKDPILGDLSIVTSYIAKECIFCQKLKAIQVEDSLKVVELDLITHPQRVKGKKGSMLAHGWTEAIVEGIHDERFSSFSVERIQRILKLLVNRFSELRKRKGVEFIGAFKDSSTHPATIIFTLPILPKRVERELKAIEAQKISLGECPYCEKKCKFMENELMKVCIAHAPQSTIHLMAYTKKHIDSFCKLKDEDLFYMAEMIKNISLLIERAGFEFYLVFHEKPKSARDYHIWIEFISKRFIDPLSTCYGISFSLDEKGLKKVIHGTG